MVLDVEYEQQEHNNNNSKSSWKYYIFLLLTLNLIKWYKSVGSLCKECKCGIQTKKSHMVDLEGSSHALLYFSTKWHY